MKRIPRTLIAILAACAMTSLAMVVAQDAPAPAPVGVITVQKTVVVGKNAEKQDDAKKDDAEKKKVEGVAVKEEVVEVKAAVMDVVVEAAPVQVFIANGNNANLDPLVNQFSQQFRPILRTELHFIKAICDPSPEQQRAIAREGYKAFRTAVKKYAQNQQQMMQGQWRGGQQPDPRKLVQDGLLAAVKEHFTPEQTSRYEAEIARRDADFKAVAVHNLVCKLDQELILTADQRARLTESLTKEWKDAWGGSLEMFMYGNDYLPVLPDKIVIPILDPVQKKLWTTSQKTQVNAFFNGMGFLGGVEMEPDPIDEAVFAELKQAEEAEAKAEAEARAKIQGPPKPQQQNGQNGIPAIRFMAQPN